MLTKLESPPFSFCEQISSIGNQCFICYGWLINIDDVKFQLKKYNASTREWTDFDIKYPENFELDVCGTTFDHENKLLYICDSKKLSSIDLSMKQCKILCKYHWNMEGFITCIKIKGVQT